MSGGNFSNKKPTHFEAMTLVKITFIYYFTLFSRFFSVGTIKKKYYKIY